MEPMQQRATPTVEPSSVWPFALGPIVGASAVRVCVLAGYGLNCEEETAYAFSLLGACVRTVHVADLVQAPSTVLNETELLVFTGGFSFGDHVASGRVLANRLRFRCGDALTGYVDRGGLVLGICNGFQTLVKLGLLPAVGRKNGEALAEQQATLLGNRRPGYRNAWIRLGFDAQSPCVFTRTIPGAVLELPSRHGEGRLMLANDVAHAVAESHLVPVRYVDDAGAATEAWPENPSGSPGGVAGLCDQTGRVFGLMPHPEGFSVRTQHPNWQMAPLAQTFGEGLGLLACGVRAVLGG